VKQKQGRKEKKAVLSANQQLDCAPSYDGIETQLPVSTCFNE